MNYELFNNTVLLRMKIPSLVSQTQEPPSSFTLHDSHKQPQEPPSSQTEEPHVSPPSSQGFSNVYYNSVTAQIMDLKSGQNRLFEQQNQILAQQASLNPMLLFWKIMVLLWSISCLLYTSPSPRDS